MDLAAGDKRLGLQSGKVYEQSREGHLGVAASNTRLGLQSSEQRLCPSALQFGRRTEMSGDRRSW